MSEPRHCVRCQRLIDQWAGICPFCNWNQTQPPPEHEIIPQPVADYKPPAERSMKEKILIASVAPLLLVASFAVGVVINSSDAPENAPESLEEQAAEHNVDAPKRAETPLIPTNERGGFEQPITSAPPDVGANGTTTDSQRTDATAVSAVEYAEMARRAKAEKQRLAAVVDPRTITAPPYVPRPRPPAPVSQSIGTRTRPVAEYQPVPRIATTGKARLSMIIGTDGRVSEVQVQRTVPGGTAQLINAVRSWRFKPATENGVPVAAPYTVEISFR